MDELTLPPWTLNARLTESGLEFCLSDGRRLACRNRSEPVSRAHSGASLSAERLLGSELTAKLAASGPRVLHLQYDGDLDYIDWESIALGSVRMAERFTLARQPLSNREAPTADLQLTETLEVTIVHGGRSRVRPRARAVGIVSLESELLLDAVTRAQVVVLDGIALSEFLNELTPPIGARLFVCTRPESMHSIGTLLDVGATALCFGDECDIGGGDVFEDLLSHLTNGVSVGDAIRWLHRRHTSVKLAARLYGEPGMRFTRLPTSASRRQVTSLSFDLVGSTDLLRRLGDEAYAEMLDSLHARCTDVVRRHGGRPDDPQGDDGIMCYFGFPLAFEDAPAQAVESGLNIAQTVAEMSISVRVGIATGEVAIKAGQPVGLSIHLAARLQKAAAPGTVLVAESTRSLVAHVFEFEPPAEQPYLKDIVGAGPCHVATSSRAGEHSHRLDMSPFLTPFVGRFVELERLERSWEAACDRGPTLAVVRADPGMGKSRLVREFGHRLARDRVRVIECRCRADAAATPFLTLSEALRRWLATESPDRPGDASAQLAAVFHADARRNESIALLSSLLGLATEPPCADPTRQKQRLLGTLLEWFASMARDRPCCLVIEDWHWADPSLRDLVQQLLDRRGTSRLLIVVTTREADSQLALGKAPPEDIYLAGLSSASACELVALACADVSLPPGLVRMLAARGDGVPLFLEEAARMAVEIGAHRPGADIRALDMVPSSLSDLLMARLDGLGEAKRVAQTAAVLGREFPLTLLSSLFEASGAMFDSAALAECMDTLVNSGLLCTSGSEGYAFKHALVRDAAYASLWSRDRVALHALVVPLLKQHWPELVARQPELLAMHQTEAGLYQDALVQWEVAARHATTRSAELEAISHLQRAIAVLGRTDAGLQRDRTALRLQLLLAARLIATEGYGADAVLHAYGEAEAVCAHVGDEAARFKIEMGLEGYRFMRGDFGAALEHGRRAADIAARSDDVRRRLHAHWGLACTLFHKGELLAAMREMEIALAIYTPDMHRLFGVQDPGIMCMAYSSWGLWELGRPDAALARIDSAIAIARAVEHKFSQAVALAYSVSVEWLRGNVESALARADACIRVCDEAGFPVWLAITRCIRGRLLCELGRIDEGLRDMQAGQRLWLSTGSMVSQPLYLSLRAEGFMLAGRFQEARVCVEEGLAITDRYGERQLQTELKRLRGELALQAGELKEGESWLKGAYAQAMRQHRIGFALRSATAIARIWADRQDVDRARRLLSPLVARWTEGRDTRDVRIAEALCRELA